MLLLSRLYETRQRTNNRPYFAFCTTKRLLAATEALVSAELAVLAWLEFPAVVSPLALVYQIL